MAADDEPGAGLWAWREWFAGQGPDGRSPLHFPKVSHRAIEVALEREAEIPVLLAEARMEGYRAVAEDMAKHEAEIAAAYAAVAAIVSESIESLMEEGQKPLDVALENFAEIVIPKLTPADARAALDAMIEKAKDAVIADGRAAFDACVAQIREEARAEGAASVPGEIDRRRSVAMLERRVREVRAEGAAEERAAIRQLALDHYDRDGRALGPWVNAFLLAVAERDNSWRETSVDGWLPRDDVERETVAGKRTDCPEVLGSTVCTRPAGHLGDHVATGMVRVYARWPQDSVPPASEGTPRSSVRLPSDRQGLRTSSGTSADDASLAGTPDPKSAAAEVCACGHARAEHTRPVPGEWGCGHTKGRTRILGTPYGLCLCNQFVAERSRP